MSYGGWICPDHHHRSSACYLIRPGLQVGHDVYDAHSGEDIKMHTMLLRPLVDSQFVTAVTGMHEASSQVGVCNSCVTEGKSIRVPQHASVHKVCYLDVWKHLPSDDNETRALREAIAALYTLQTGGMHSSSGMFLVAGMFLAACRECLYIACQAVLGLPMPRVQVLLLVTTPLRFSMGAGDELHRRSRLDLFRQPWQHAMPDRVNLSTVQCC